MFIYKSEVLKIPNQWFSGYLRETDISSLDVLINKRTAEGWEFVTYTWMENVWGLYLFESSSILVTFRKEK